MHAIETAIAALIRSQQLIGKDQTVLVAASAGPDSTALLNLLVRLLPGQTVAAAYLDHQLRDPAATSAESHLVESLCGHLGVAFFHQSIDVPAARRYSGESTEACARRLRYQALEKLRGRVGAALIAVGHTADDQAEEVLLRLLRGTGSQGLSGMELKNGPVIRPLLQTTKAQLLEYLEVHQLEYSRDPSNQSRRFRRNRVRHQLLPLLEKEFNPSIRTTLRNTAAIFQEENAFLAREAERCYRTLVTPREPAATSGSTPITLDIAGFCQQPVALQRRILEKLCWQTGSRPSFTAIEALRKLARDLRPGAEYHLPARVIASRETNLLRFNRLPDRPPRRQNFAPAAEFELIVESPGQYRVAALERTLGVDMVGPPGNITTVSGLLMDLESISFPLLLRAPRPGETFKPLGAPGRKKVFRYLSDRKIPRRQRGRFGVLLSGGEIVAVPGLAISDRVKVKKSTRYCLKITWE